MDFLHGYVVGEVFSWIYDWCVAGLVSLGVSHPGVLLWVVIHFAWRTTQLLKWSLNEEKVELGS